MRPKLYHLIVIALMLCSYNQLKSQSLENKVDDILQHQFSNTTPGAIVLIAKEDRVLYKKAFGKANLERQKALNPNQKLRIASITKQFTAMAILKLAYEGKLSLKDSIQKFIPGFSKNKRVIRVHHLLSHTSGLLNQYDIKNWEKSIKDQDITPLYLINLFKDKQPAFEPNNQYQYSNLGYMVLTYIIEESSKQSYAQYLENHFFKPLDMENTKYGDDSSITKNVIGYSRNGDIYKEAPYLDMNIPQGAGGLTSTVDDLHKWNKAVFNQSLLGKYLDQGHVPGKLNNGQTFGYGFGWQIGEVQGQKAIKHDGIINGYVSYQIYLPQQKAYAAILTNCDCTENIAELAAKLVAIAIDRPYQYQEIELPIKELTKFQGKFMSTSGEEKMIQLQDGVLYYFSKGGSKSPLVPIEKATLYNNNNLNKFNFELNENGEAIGFNLASFDIPTKWRKTGDLESINSTVSTSELLKPYVGKYKFKKAFTLEIILKENQLVGLVGNDQKELFLYDEHAFFSKTNDIKLHFMLNDKGEISGVKLIQVHDMMAERVE